MDISNILDSKIIVRLQYVNLENNPEHKYVTIVTNNSVYFLLEGTGKDGELLSAHNTASEATEAANVLGYTLPYNPSYYEDGIDSMPFTVEGFMSFMQSISYYANKVNDEEV